MPDVVMARSPPRRSRPNSVHGEVKPKDKLDLATKLQSEGAVVAMAGDGINDAPALTKVER